MIFITIIISIIAGIFESVMDILADKFEVSVFSSLNPEFWDKKQSWKNKYKGGSKIIIYLKSNLLVMFTDGWHLAKALHSLFLFLMAVGIYLISTSVWQFIVLLLILYTLKKIVFELFYSKILICRTP